MAEFLIPAVVIAAALGALFYYRRARERSLQLQSQIDDLAASVKNAALLAQSVATRIDAVSASIPQPDGPPAAAPAPDLFRDMTETELVALAESIAILRPLVPYPGWHHDADWTNPDFAFQLRRAIWQTFHDRGGEAVIAVAWHAGTRLQLRPGDDLSSQIFIAGCMEPNEFAFLDRWLRPGMTFFDVGANAGVYTIFAARRVGREGAVWAFEPSSREFRQLQSNVALNGDDARLLPIALSDRGGSAELTIAEQEHAGLNTLLNAFVHQSVKAIRKETVDLRRLDDLVAAQPPARIDVIKIDAEGAELQILQGAVDTLRKYSPALLFEVSKIPHQRENRENLTAFIRNQGYQLYFFDPSGLPAPAAPGTYSANMLAMPAGSSLSAGLLQIWPYRS